MRVSAALVITGLALGVMASFLPERPPGYASAVPCQPAPVKPGLVLIDPGHGGIDSGAGTSPPYEKDIVLAVGLETARILRSFQVPVVMTRDRDTALDHLISSSLIPNRHRRDLASRAKIALESGADLWVSLHCNTSANSSASGAMFIHQPTSEESAALAFAIHREVAKVQRGRQFLPFPDGFFVLRHRPVTVLVELGFLTNPEERALLLDPLYQQEMARAVAGGIVEFLSWYRPAHPSLTED